MIDPSFGRIHIYRWIKRRFFNRNEEKRLKIRRGNRAPPMPKKIKSTEEKAAAGEETHRGTELESCECCQRVANYL